MSKINFIHKSKVRRLVLLLATAGALFLYLMNTNPENANILVTFLPLLLAWLLIFLVVSFSDLLLKHASVTFVFTFAATIATVMTFLLMFSALGSVGLFDVVLLISLAALVVFYVRRTWSK